MINKQPLRGLFTDQELDPESGLYNYNARLYDQVIGRFISADSIVPEPFNPQSLNRYSYCRNNPLIYVDPTGRFIMAATYGWAPSTGNGGWAGFYAGMGEASASGDSPGTNSSVASSSTTLDRIQTFLDVLGIFDPTPITDLVNAGIFALRGEKSDAILSGIAAFPYIGDIIGKGGKVAKAVAKARSTGKAGEQAVRAIRDIGKKVRINIKGRTRVPDGLTDTVISEVKNVNKQNFTQQLRDFSDYAKKTGRQFDLCVRPDTKLSGPLQDAVRAGDINLEFIP